MPKFFKSNYLDVYNLTAEHLRAVADKMDSDKVDFIELCPDYDDLYGSSIEEQCMREETFEELMERKRIEKKAKEDDKIHKKQNKVYRRIREIKTALSLKVKIEEPPVKTLTPDVYWVYKGCKFEGLEFSSTGFTKIIDGNCGSIVKKEKDA